MGWKIDYRKLLGYLEEKYATDEVFYFGGIEIHEYPYDYLANASVPVEEVEKHLMSLLTHEEKRLTEAAIVLIGRHLARVRFYRKLQAFGYRLILKPVKLYAQEDGSTKRKANVDVDMTFYMMKEELRFDRAVVLSGDGDFLPVLKHLQNERKKEVLVLARGPRTAKEIRQFAGSKFLDFARLKHKLHHREK